MKETMTKRFFAPYWKCEEIEHELEQLAKDGWHLEHISGFGKFRFIRSQPTPVQYFFTFSLAKESGMIQTEQNLIRQFKAKKTSGNFIELLKNTSVYCVAKSEGLLQRKIYRNIYLRHLALQYVLTGLFLLSASIAGIAASCYWSHAPLLDTSHLLLALPGFGGGIVMLRHLSGLFYLRKQYLKSLQENQRRTAAE